MLDNFFRINLPCGIARNDKDEWYAFNREYVPIGFNNIRDKSRYNEMDLPIYTKYEKLTKEMLLDIADNDPDRITWDNKGEIREVLLYNDRTNPTSQVKDIPQLWNKYFRKLELLSKLVAVRKI